MKKLLSLVLALVLCLTAASAFAAVASKTVGIVTVIDDVMTNNEVAVPETAADEVAELIEKGPAAFFGLEGIDNLAVDEYDVMDVSTNDVEADDDGKVVAKFHVLFPYAKDQVVTVLLGIVNEDKTIEWHKYEGVADENGDIIATVDKDVLENATRFACGVIE